METINKYLRGDKAIWLVTVFLAIASALLVYSSIVTLAYRHHEGNTLVYLLRHGFFLLAGLGIIYVVHKMKYTYFSRIAQLALYVSIPLLLLTLIIGVEINGATRWLPIPGTGQTFQTSDFAKLALVMFLARIISQKQSELKSWKKGFMPIMVPVLIVCGLILPADLSTALMLFTVSVILMFIGGIPIKFLGGMFAVGLVGISLVFAIESARPGTFPRVETWINRMVTFGEEDSKANYQIEQAKIAAATGGITGKGPGKSTQRNFLPHPYSDFIFAMVLEEYGGLGGLGILLLYLILLFRAVRIVSRCPKHFGGLLAIGISFMLVFQAMINMAVAVDLLPVTGQPMPLVSMGGTSVWFTCIAIGIVLSVSRTVEDEEENTSSGNYVA